MTNFDELLRMQGEMASLAARIAGETDASKIQEITASLQRKGGELQQMCRAIEQQTPVSQPPQPPPSEAVVQAQQRAEAEMRAMAEQVLAQITQASPAAAEAVAKLRAAPNFLSGMLGPK